VDRGASVLEDGVGVRNGITSRVDTDKEEYAVPSNEVDGARNEDEKLPKIGVRLAEEEPRSGDVAIDIVLEGGEGEAGIEEEISSEELRSRELTAIIGVEDEIEDETTSVNEETADDVSGTELEAAVEIEGVDGGVSEGDGYDEIEGEAKPDDDGDGEDEDDEISDSDGDAEGNGDVDEA
jgi:hypothetical protein